MTVTCEQVFYGRAPHGYATLGASSGAKPFAVRIEALCGAVGTPAANSAGEPFLLSVPEDDHVFMICIRKGVLDSMGRETLFFHALIALKSDLSKANANAMSLFAQGAFAERMPNGDVEPFRMDVPPAGNDHTMPTNGSVPPHFPPCFVRSADPAPDVIRAFLGNRLNDFAWATFAFQPMTGFRVQVLPLRAAAPRDLDERDACGRILRSSMSSSPSSGEMPKGGGVRNARHGETPVEQQATTSNTSSMFKLSLVANIVLAIACIALCATRKNASPTLSRPPEQMVVVTNVVKQVVTNTIEVAQTLSSEEVQKIRSEAQNEIVSEFPEYFTETDCEKKFSYWETKKNTDDFFRLLLEWIQFFETHPRKSKP